MPRSPRHGRALFVMALAIAAAAFAACGGTPPATGAGGTGGPATAGPVAVSRACELLTDADITALTGSTVVSKDDDVADTVYANHCRWTLERADGGAGTLDLGILSPGGRERYDHTGGSSGLEPIEGLPADAAGLDDTTGSVFAVRGDTLVDVFPVGLGLDTEAKTALVRRVLEHLSGTSGPPATSSTGSQATTPPDGNGGGTAGDACDLLTDEEILEVTGLPALGKESTPRVGLWDAQCLWEVQSASGVPAAITLTIKRPGGRASWDQYLVPIQGELMAIDGLGDAAFGRAHWPTHVLVGDTYVSVQFMDFPDPEGPVSTELARRVVANLGG